MRSEALKKAQKNYYEKTKGERKNITIGVSSKEYERQKELLKRKGLTISELWRTAIKWAETLPDADTIGTANNPGTVDE